MKVDNTHIVVKICYHSLTYWLLYDVGSGTSEGYNDGQNWSPTESSQLMNQESNDRACNNFYADAGDSIDGVAEDESVRSYLSNLKIQQKEALQVKWSEELDLILKYADCHWYLQASTKIKVIF